MVKEMSVPPAPKVRIAENPATVIFGIIFVTLLITGSSYFLSYLRIKDTTPSVTIVTVK